jgi:Ca2+-binding EF-hand superfamily protein
MTVDHKIGYKDVDAILRSLGRVQHKRSIEQMIWEVDENLDELVDFDELQLTYHRNINDTSKSEPCLFFKLLEVLYLYFLQLLL